MVLGRYLIVKYLDPQGVGGLANLWLQVQRDFGHAAGALQACSCRHKCVRRSFL